MESTLKEILNKSGMAVLPTDTIYGLHTKALDHSAVDKIYSLKGRNSQKPLIVLISSLEDLELFGVELSDKEKSFLERIWPNPVSVILEVKDPKWDYLHRGINSIAFRMPKNSFLLELVKEVGPLVSTSANPEGEKAAGTTEEAKEYFGDKVDFYQDAGELKSEASTVIKMEAGEIEIIRQGVFQVV